MNVKIMDQDLLETLKDDYRNSGVTNFEVLLDWICSPPKYTTIRVPANRQDELKLKLETILHNLFETKQRQCPRVYVNHHMNDLLVVTSNQPREITPVAHCEVIVDLQCGLAVLRGADVFAAGVLGAPSFLQQGDVVAIYADVEKKCLKGLSQKFMGIKHFVGNGEAVMNRNQLFNNRANGPRGIAILMTEPVNDCPPLNSALDDAMFLQNLPSVVCGHVLHPQPGEIILDMCAAPGGKTTHIASLMNNQGLIFALDKTTSKIERLKNNLDLQNLTNARCFAFDSTKAVDFSKEICPNSSFQELVPPFAPKSFDKIILDSPCSALGKRPVIGNKLNVKEANSYPNLQRKLMCSAVPLLKPGGVLVYSTCTLLAAENERIVKWALDKFECLSLAEQTPRIGGFGLSGQGLVEEDRLKLQRFDCYSQAENESIDTIGFFIAKFFKR